MKKIILFVIIFFSIQLAAQEGPVISSAVIATRNNDTVEAKKYIDQAAQIIQGKDKSQMKDKDLAKFYFYNGFINYIIANSEKYNNLDTNALVKATQSFQNLLNYEQQIGKERYSDQARQYLLPLANSYATRGIKANNAGNYQQAFEDFQKSFKLKQDFKLGTDTTMLYNAALMAQKAENYDKALEVMEQLMDMNYRGLQFKATSAASGKVVEFPSRKAMEQGVKIGAYENPVVEGDIRPDILISTANLYRQTGDTAKYNELVSKGRKQFPENEALLRAELQQFLEAKEYDKAMVNLNQSIEKNKEAGHDDNNKLFYYIKGYILQTNMHRPDSAREAYDKAIALDSDYVEPLYMKGLTYIDEANALTEQMNKLNLNETSKYDKLQKQQKEAFEKALPYFEKAHEADPHDRDTLNALKEVYYKLKRYEEAKKIQAEIDALG